MLIGWIGGLCFYLVICMPFIMHLRNQIKPTRIWAMASLFAINSNNHLHELISKYIYYTGDCRNNLKKNRYFKYYNIKQTNHNIWFYYIILLFTNCSVFETFINEVNQTRSITSQTKPFTYYYILFNVFLIKGFTVCSVTVFCIS